MRIHMLTMGLALLAATLGGAQEDVEARIAEAESLLRSDPAKGKAAILALQKDLAGPAAAEPANVALQYQMARTHYFLREDQQAETFLRRCIELEPRHAGAHFHLGRMHADQRRYEEALAHLRKALEIDPGHVAHYLALGKTLEGLGQPEDALRVYRALIEKDPQRAIGWFRAGVALTGMNRPDDAIEMFKTAEKLDPGDPEPAYNIGVICQRLARHEEALSSFERALKLDAEDWQARAKRIQTLTALGRPEDAEAERKQVLDLHRAGKVSAPAFCREQTVLAGKPVMVFEHFELEGPRAVRYVFHVFDKPGGEAELRISLGSYEMTNRIARERKELEAGQRLYHLDGYWPDGRHATYEFFKGEPAYAVVRTWVEEILAGKREAIGGTKVDAEGRIEGGADAPKKNAGGP